MGPFRIFKIIKFVLCLFLEGNQVERAQIKAKFKSEPAGFDKKETMCFIVFVIKLFYIALTSTSSGSRVEQFLKPVPVLQLMGGV